MPRRKTIFAEGEFYHVFNRSLFHESIFAKKFDVRYFLDAATYYRLLDRPLQFSRFRALKRTPTGKESQYIVSILAFAVMPNHFHFVLRQQKRSGVHQFMLRLLNSYSHYYNAKYERKGPLFEGVFKAVRIESQEQLIHVIRYVDLNPATAYLVENPEEYEFSSFRHNTGLATSKLVSEEILLGHFKMYGRYKKFVLDNKDYQRSLKQMRYMGID